MIDFGKPVHISRFGWITGNDKPERDPISWSLDKGEGGSSSRLPTYTPWIWSSDQRLVSLKRLQRTLHFRHTGEESTNCFSPDYTTIKCPPPPTRENPLPPVPCHPLYPIDYDVITEQTFSYPGGTTQTCPE